MGEGDLPKALDQVNAKFLVRYELGLFGLPFSYTSLYKKSLSPFHNTHGKHPVSSSYFLGHLSPLSPNSVSRKKSVKCE